MPVAIPTWRKVLAAPVDIPLRSGVTTETEAEARTGLVMPMPTPATRKPGSSTSQDEVASTWDMSSQASATRNRPRAIMNREWIRTVSFPAIGATRKASIVSGRNRTPAWNGV